MGFALFIREGETAASHVGRVLERCPTQRFHGAGLGSDAFPSMCSFR